MLRAVFGHMATDAALYQFTYGRACPVPAPVKTALGLRSRCIGRTLANIPPAAVYRITQQTQEPARQRSAPAPGRPEPLA